MCKKVAAPSVFPPGVLPSYRRHWVKPLPLPMRWAEHASARDSATTLSQVVATAAHNRRHTWTLFRKSQDSPDNRKHPWTRQTDCPSGYTGSILHKSRLELC